MIEVQCSSCHTRYRIDEHVLPEGTPTFKCSRCGHVFSFEPRAQEARRSTPALEEHGVEASPKVRAPARKLDPVVAATALEQDKGLERSEIPTAAPSDLIAGSAPGSSGAASEIESSGSTPGVEQSTSAAAVAGASGTPEKPTGHRGDDEIGEDNPLARSFEIARDNESSGENLTFDFDHDRSGKTGPQSVDDHDEDDRWQVGDPEDASTGRGGAEEPGFSARNDLSRARDAVAAVLAQEAELGNAKLQERARRAGRRELLEGEFVNESSAPLYNRELLHSSRLFLALFAACAVGYGVLTLLIHSAPAAASEVLSHVPVIGERFVPPVTPASLVALRNIGSHYQQLKDGHRALVITGAAENVAGSALHVVQVQVDLRDASSREIAAQAVYCGNNLAPKMVGEMTPHEIEFFQRLDPPKSFALDPSAQCPFVLVFIDPPSGVSRFDISVAKAVPVAQTLPTSGS
jgi:predicted Zn finger-like uncharacterized protein